MTNKTHTVEIPEAYLLTLAVHGNMGDGKVPFFMQNWAETQCEKLGLRDQMLAEKAARYEEVRERARAILGKNTVDDIEQLAQDVIPATQKAMVKRGLLRHD